MAGGGGIDAWRSRPAARRIALVVLVVGLGGVFAHVMSRSPVTSSLELELDGKWPPVRSVTLVYSLPPDEQEIRRVSWFPDTVSAPLLDSPRLVPGRYEVTVTVVTEDGSRRYARQLEHGRGSRSRFDLRF
jgi:hypothetical protein